ncbi:hypothetical protein AGOR_G00047600 [Albula goreensis]|uniref:Uncharacterized protein n=1 Tax=Albula goreensis TaxID=1534307 RepID=A0A8T3DWK0_9TELE|nr:hypothetical protein AGOR_G00047600 [Albula goreensis]
MLSLIALDETVPTQMASPPSWLSVPPFPKKRRPLRLPFLPPILPFSHHIQLHVCKSGHYPQRQRLALAPQTEAPGRSAHTSVRTLPTQKPGPMSTVCFFSAVLDFNDYTCLRW